MHHTTCLAPISYFPVPWCVEECFPIASVEVKLKCQSNQLLYMESMVGCHVVFCQQGAKCSELAQLEPKYVRKQPPWSHSEGGLRLA